MAKQLRGDINNDGKLSVIDMLTIFRYKSGEISLNTEEIQRADTDNDGSVTIADALMIQKHITGEYLIDGVIE
jgi:Ca2+-binding EF-hand superfamily protein